MPELYLDEYRKALAGQTVVIACREGVLRDHFKEIIEDIRFLDRQEIRTVLFHNMSNRFANRQHFKRLESRLFNTRIVRVPPEADFYDMVLESSGQISKIIFLERKCLLDPEGRRINALSTDRARKELTDYAHLIGNMNFKGILELICRKIEEGGVERVHILPAGKNTIKHELFTLEGTGTLIANDFSEAVTRISTDEEVRVVTGILNIYRGEGFLKPRSREYISDHRDRFFVVKIDGIIVGCAEEIPLGSETVELGAMAISTKFRNQQIGFLLITSFLEEMKRTGCHRVVSLTNSPRLQSLYSSLGFVQTTPADLQDRQAQSPAVKMFVKSI